MHQSWAMITYPERFDLQVMNRTHTSLIIPVIHNSFSHLIDTTDTVVDINIPLIGPQSFKKTFTEFIMLAGKSAVETTEPSWIICGRQCAFPRFGEHRYYWLALRNTNRRLPAVVRHLAVQKGGSNLYGWIPRCKSRRWWVVRALL